MTMKSCVFLWSAILYGLFLEPVSGVMVKIKNNGARNKRNSEMEAEHEKFMIPKTLKLGYEIIVIGNMTRIGYRKRVTVNLVTGSGVPDYENVACQVEARLDNTTSIKKDNEMSIKIISNGYVEEIYGDYQDINATEFFAGSEFNFSFKISEGSDYEDGHSIEIKIGNSHLDKCRLKHNINDIRFLTLHGDIERVGKLEFGFGNSSVTMPHHVG